MTALFHHLTWLASILLAAGLALGLALGVTVDAGAEAAIERTEAPADAELYFVTPEAGATVSSPVTVVFGLAGMGVAPSGVEKANTGHHHLLIDVDLGDPSLPIPNDANHVHFGGGQTQTSVELAPGTHTLQLVLGDHRHIPHDPIVMSKKITITVE